LTIKLVCQSHQRQGTFSPNLGTIGLWVLELFAYATDGRTDKSKAYFPFHTSGGIIIIVITGQFIRHRNVAKVNIRVLTISSM